MQDLHAELRGPSGEKLGTTHLFFFKDCSTGEEKFIIPPKKSTHLFFGTHKHAHTTSEVSVSTTLRIAARLRGMYIFRCEENSFLAPWDEGFAFFAPKKRGRHIGKPYGANYTTPWKERHFFFLRENQW